MTIKEAVETYNQVNDKIRNISELLKRINNPDKKDIVFDGSTVRISSDDLDQINIRLNEYRDILKESLNLQFGEAAK